ncbi:NADP oxidoreductase [Virgisporangium aliadipatigenens]|uniref:NADP oxidoreductase n=1 Tax=Virgisporangium aliadipatigenens TaxID=741659 RepID=A0A8J3YRL3_9ACTN|nr:NADP oxidoreductase [Virgisporangium aliadipatigenens]
MRIAIIGVGGVGRALAQAFTVAGHVVVVGARHPEHAQKAADELKVAAAGSSREAVEGAELVVLAVPAKAVAKILDETADLLDGMIVVDPTNPVDDNREAILRSTASLAEAATLLAPGARVVKAFNTVLAGRLNDPVVDGIPLDGYYAGDDVAAKAVVAGLIADTGLRPIDVGDLLTARALELMAYLHISLNIQQGWPWRTGWKLLGQSETRPR